MPLNTPLRRLGEIAFILTDEGVLIRSAVGTVYADGGYTLLNQDTRTHFFDLKEALRAAETLIRYRLMRDETLTEELRSEFNGRLALLRDPACVELIAKQPIKPQRTPLPTLFFMKEEDGEIDPVFPTDYIEPGTDVWLIITPTSLVSFTQYWRPKPYFLLKVGVHSVGLLYASNGYHLLYTLSDSRYYPNQSHMFASEAEARARLQDMFARQTGGSIELDAITVFTVEDELAAWEQQLERLRGDDSSATRAKVS